MASDVVTLSELCEETGLDEIDFLELLEKLGLPPGRDVGGETFFSADEASVILETLAEEGLLDEESEEQEAD